MTAKSIYTVDPKALDRRNKIDSRRNRTTFFDMPNMLPQFIRLCKCHIYLTPLLSSPLDHKNYLRGKKHCGD